MIAILHDYPLKSTFPNMAQIYLRIPVDYAKAQLAQRVQLARDLHSKDEKVSTYRERYGWHEQNITILETMFSSNEIATQYKEFGRTLGIKPDSFSYALLGSLRDNLKSLADSIASFPRLPGNSITESSPSIPVKARDITAAKWEFGTIEVETPSREAKYSPNSIIAPGVVKGHFNMEKTLEVLARDGWDIFAVLPSYQETGHDHILITSYRLFYKRQASSGG